MRTQPDSRINWLRNPYPLLCLQSAVVLAAIYGRMLGGEFLSDSLSFVGQVHRWVELGDLAGYLNTWTNGSAGDLLAYRPLKHTLYVAEYLLFGADATAWRFVNLLLHGATAVLVGGLAFRLSDSRWPGRSISVASGATCVFLLRPSGIETVAWVADGNGLLAVLFTLASAHALLNARGCWNRWYVVSVLCYALGLASKETAIVAPALLVPLCLLGLGAEQSSRATRVLRLVPFGVVSMLYLGLRLVIFGDATETYVGIPSPEWGNPWWWRERRETFIRAIAPTIPGHESLAHYVRVATLGTALVACANVIRRSFPLRSWFVGVVWVVLVTLVSLPIVTISDWGEGGRNFYLWGAALALLLAPAFASWRTALVVAPILFVLTGLHQKLIVDSWQSASSQMRELLAELSDLADELPNQGHAVVMAPDQINGAYFLRNAQGPSISLPFQSRDLSQYMTLTLPNDVDVILKRQIGLYGRERISVWCWSSLRRSLQPIAIGGSDLPELAVLRDQIEKQGCR